MNNTYIAKRINRRERLEREQKQQQTFLEECQSDLTPLFWVVIGVVMVLLLVVRPA